MAIFSSDGTFPFFAVVSEEYRCSVTRTLRTRAGRLCVIWVPLRLFPGFSSYTTINSFLIHISFIWPIEAKGKNWQSAVYYVHTNPLKNRKKNQLTIPKLSNSLKLTPALFPVTASSETHPSLSSTIHGIIPASWARLKVSTPLAWFSLAHFQRYGKTYVFIPRLQKWIFKYINI